MLSHGQIQIREADVLIAPSPIFYLSKYLSYRSFIKLSNYCTWDDSVSTVLFCLYFFSDQIFFHLNKLKLQVLTYFI